MAQKTGALIFDEQTDRYDIYHSDVGRGHGDLPKRQFQAETQQGNGCISESPSKGVHAGGHQGRTDY